MGLRTAMLRPTWQARGVELAAKGRYDVAVEALNKMIVRSGPSTCSGANAVEARVKFFNQDITTANVTNARAVYIPSVEFPEDLIAKVCEFLRANATKLLFLVLHANGDEPCGRGFKEIE